VRCGGGCSVPGERLIRSQGKTLDEKRRVILELAPPAPKVPGGVTRCGAA